MAAKSVGRILKDAGIKIREKYRTDISTEEVKNLYENFKSAAKVGRALGISTQLVYLRLKKAGIDTTRDIVANPIIPPSRSSPEPQIEQVVKSYYSGGLGLVSKEFHIGYYRAKQIITDAGMEIKSGSVPIWRKLCLPAEEIIQLYPKLSLEKLAEKYKVSTWAMKRLFADNGLEIKKY